MKISFSIGVILVLLLLISCSQQEQTTQEPTEEKTTGLLTRTYTYEDENSTLKIIVNNLDNTGSVKMTLLIPDKEEWMYSLEEGTHQSDEVSEVFSITCEMLWGIYRDFDSAMTEFSETPWIDQSLTDEESKEQKEMTEFLKGFKATEFSITFTDKEDNSKIAECYNMGLEQEDVIYQGYSTTTQKEMDLENFEKITF